MASAVNPTVKEEVPDDYDQDREKHEESRNFFYSLLNETVYVSGKMSETVLEALESSKHFKTHVGKNQEKDIIIERKKPRNADIATHFPCCLIEEGEELTVSFGGKKMSVTESQKMAVLSKQLFIFYIARQGGKNFKTKPFLKNMSHKNIPYLCVYAYKDETVKDALERDGRFLKIAYGEGSDLSGSEDSKTVEMCYKVNKSLKEKRFNLKRDRAVGAKPDSGSTTAEQPAAPAQEQAESIRGSEESAKAKSPANVPGESTPSQGISLRKKPPAIPGSEQLLQELRAQFEGLVEIMKERPNVKGKKEAVELLRQEFGKNIEPLWRVKTGKLLMEMSRSVCHITNYSCNNEGSGFLLFDRFVLTNAHLIQDFSNISNDVQYFWNRTEIRMQVNFSFEEENKTGPDWNVKRVVFGAFGQDKKMGYLDYALLELSVDTVEHLPPPLCTQFSSPALRGGVCIIGHPDGGVKKFDFCSIIEYEQRGEATEGNEKILQLMKSDLNIVAKDSPVVTYKTCFYHGSSGSPVFGVDGRVFAMHSGGYPYKIDGRTMSVIEYAIPLMLILQHLWEFFKSNRQVFQIIQEGPNDPLWHLIYELDHSLAIDLASILPPDQQPSFPPPPAAPHPEQFSNTHLSH